MTVKNLPYWLAVGHLPMVRLEKFWQAMDTFSAIENVFSASQSDLQACGFFPQEIKRIVTFDWQLIEKDLLWLQQNDHHVLTIESADYPLLLKEIYAPPMLLYVRGNLAALNQKQIAIVGSRNASISGLEQAHHFASELSHYGLVITSGLARGIDAAAHRGALAGEGVTLAILGTGIDRIYPSQHTSLADDILQNAGAIVSEFPGTLPPFAYHFPRRNRIISGLSLGVLVVEAHLKSGSLITARLASEQGRDVFAVPGHIQKPQARGCHHLIRQGALLVESAEDIATELKLNCSNKLEDATSSKLTKLNQEEKQMLQHIDYEATPLDVIILRSRLTAGKVSSILLALELQGMVQIVPGGYIKHSFA